MKKVLFERVQICEIIYHENDLKTFNEEHPGAKEKDYLDHLKEVIADQDECWNSAEVFVIGHIETYKE